MVHPHFVEIGDEVQVKHDYMLHNEFEAIATKAFLENRNLISMGKNYPFFKITACQLHEGMENIIAQ